MNIAISVWGDRVSPVFEVSKQLLLVTTREQEIVAQRLYPFAEPKLLSLRRLFLEQEVAIFLCGALCTPWRQRLEALGVEVVPFVTGRIDPLLQRVLREEELGEFLMPGCRRRVACRHLRRGAGGHEKKAGRRSS